MPFGSNTAPGWPGSRPSVSEARNTTQQPAQNTVGDATRRLDSLAVIEANRGSCGGAATTIAMLTDEVEAEAPNGARKRRLTRCGFTRSVDQLFEDGSGG